VKDFKRPAPQVELAFAHRPLKGVDQAASPQVLGDWKIAFPVTKALAM
jgi:hypothetical protein